MLIATPFELGYGCVWLHGALVSTGHMTPVCMSSPSTACETRLLLSTNLVQPCGVEWGTYRGSIGKISMLLQGGCGLQCAQPTGRRFWRGLCRLNVPIVASDPGLSDFQRMLFSHMHLNRCHIQLSVLTQIVQPSKPIYSNLKPLVATCSPC